MESLDIVLEKSDKTYTPDEKIDMAQTKNAYYVEMIKSMDESAIIDGAIDFIKKAKEKGIKTAIASSSKNAKLILEKTNLTNLFDAIADGCDIKNSKPAPDVFLVGAKKLDINPCDCLVIEDAKAGVKAGIKAGMEVLAVGDAQNENDAIYSYNSLKEAIEILAE